MQHPCGCSNTSHAPLGCPTLKQKGNGVAVTALSLLSPCHPPAQTATILGVALPCSSVLRG